MNCEDVQHWKAYYCNDCQSAWRALLPDCECCGGSTSLVECWECGSEDIERAPGKDIINYRPEGIRE